LLSRTRTQPSVVVRPNPVLFELPPSEDTEDESKENQSPSNDSNKSNRLPYRSVFCVLTLDSVLIYDTHHTQPLSILRGLHYAGLTDCCWSQDGLNLIVSSTDGYISIVNFEPGELGQVYQPPITEEVVETVKEEERSKLLLPSLPTLPPCEPGQATVLEGPPAKRAKKTRITPTLISSSPVSTTTTVVAGNTTTTNNTAEKRPICETDSVGAAVTKLSLGGEQPKKKKRIQPLLISSTF
jgi:chromatin assembly factor 1 subunit B